MPSFAPDLLTALNMTALAAWSQAWVLWVLGTPYKYQGMPPLVGSVFVFGVAYAMLAIESRLPHWLLQMLALGTLSFGISLFSVALERFAYHRQRHTDALMLGLPLLLTAGLGLAFLPSTPEHFRRSQYLVFLLQIGFILWLLWRMRGSTLGRGWALLVTGVSLQALPVMMMLLVPANRPTATTEAVSALAMAGRWGACIAMFLNVVLNSVGLALMLRDRHHAQEQMQARLDTLTQLPTRITFIQALSHHLADAAQHMQPMALLVLDIDHFKHVNDQYGHLAGDQVIQTVARVLQNHARPDDLAARYGGEEFVLLLPRCTPQAAHLLAQQLCDTVHATSIVLDNGHVLQVSVSVGVHAQVPAPDTQWRSWMAAADGAMYTAKRNGRNQVAISDSSPDPAPVAATTA